MFVYIIQMSYNKDAYLLHWKKFLVIEKVNVWGNEDVGTFFFVSLSPPSQSFPVIASWPASSSSQATGGCIKD